MIDKITVRGTYLPVGDNAPFVIGTTLFVPKIENTTNVSEEVFYKLLRGATESPKWFEIKEHNFKHFLEDQCRTTPLPDAIKEMLAKVSPNTSAKAKEIIEDIEKEPETPEPETPEPETPEPETPETKTPETETPETETPETEISEVETVKDETEEDAKTAATDSDIEAVTEEPKKKGGRKKKTETEE